MLATPSASTAIFKTSASAAISCQTLLSAGAIGARVPALAVIAEGALAGIRSWLLSIAALRLPLVLVEVSATGLILIRSHAVLLIPAVLLIEVGLGPTCSVLLVEIGLVPAGTLLS